MKKKDLQSKDIKELEKLVATANLDLIKNRVKIAGGKEKSLKNAWKLRKEIAQVLTVLKEKELIK